MSEWRKRMQIYPKDADAVRRDATQSSRAADGDAVGVISATPTSVDRSDRAVTTDAGRASTARRGAPGRAPLDPVRASQIRHLVLSGAYDTLEVVDAVARRLLDSGDL
jgi:hypothetical protein